jgi:hypothetical protein
MCLRLAASRGRPGGGMPGLNRLGTPESWRVKNEARRPMIGSPLVSAVAGPALIETVTRGSERAACALILLPCPESSECRRGGGIQSSLMSVFCVLQVLSQLDR